jgi:hypothetical protein
LHPRRPETAGGDSNNGQEQREPIRAHGGSITDKPGRLSGKAMGTFAKNVSAWAVTVPPPPEIPGKVPVGNCGSTPDVQEKTPGAAIQRIGLPT